MGSFFCQPKTTLIRLHAIQEKQAGGVPSPLTGKPTEPVHSIDVEDLARAYEKGLQVDIRSYLQGVSSLVLRRCRESGYRFYHPGHVVGDDPFYRALARHDWYYQESKWEFEESVRFLPPNGNLLEIGPGRGGFLRACRIARPGLRTTGLELNHAAAATARENGLDVREEELELHILSRHEKYDSVCAFQVLEHISDPLTFLKNCVSALKPGGQLMVAVPDNTQKQPSSLFVRPDDPLNMPPHHQGLWDVTSMAFLSRILPLRLRHLHSETVWQESQLDNYLRQLRAELKKRHGAGMGRCLYWMGSSYLRMTLRCLAPFLPAHCLLAIFEKEA